MARKPRGDGRPTPWLMKPGEVADVFRVDPKTPVRWAHDGLIPSVRTDGKQHRFSSTAVINRLVESGLDEVEAITMVEASRQAPRSTSRQRTRAARRAAPQAEQETNTP